MVFSVLFPAVSQAAEPGWLQSWGSGKSFCLYSVVGDGNQPHPSWELATSIMNESRRNCSGLLRISLYSFGWVVILKVKMIALNTNFDCIPSDQRAFGRKGSVGLCRSVQWPVSVTSCCWAGWRCWSWVLLSLPLLELPPPCEGVLRASVCKAGMARLAVAPHSYRWNDQVLIQPFD